MKATEAAYIVDQALQLEPCDKLRIRCYNRKEVQATRMALSRAAGKLPYSLSSMVRVECSLVNNEVIVSRNEAVRAMTITRFDGSVEVLLSAEQVAERDRIAAMMEEDGVAEEEIQRFKQGFGR